MQSMWEMKAKRMERSRRTRTNENVLNERCVHDVSLEYERTSSAVTYVHGLLSSFMVWCICSWFILSVQSFMIHFVHFKSTCLKFCWNWSKFLLKKVLNLTFDVDNAKWPTEMTSQIWKLHPNYELNVSFTRYQQIAIRKCNEVNDWNKQNQQKRRKQTENVVNDFKGATFSVHVQIDI